MWNNLEANKKIPKQAQGPTATVPSTPTEAQSFYTVLTTELKNISAKLSGQKSVSSGASGSVNSSGWSRGYQEWRKKKIDGKDLVEMEGRTWYWVPEFVCPNGTFSGMYMTHKPGADHQEWLRKKKYWADCKRRNGNNRNDDESRDPPPATDDSDAGSKKLIPTEKLKQALMTSHGMMEMQADAFLASLN